MYSTVLSVLSVFTFRFHYFLPQKHLLEAPFLLFWDFTVFVAIEHPRSALEWSPIQVLTVAQVAKIQCSYEKWCCQFGIAVDLHL